MSTDGETGGTHPTAEGEVQLHLALETSGLALWTWDVGTGTVTWSPSPTWLPESTPLDGPETLIERHVHPDDRGSVRESLARALNNGCPIDVTFRVTSANDEPRWLLARGIVPLDDAPLDDAPLDDAPRDQSAARRRGAGVLLDITGRTLARNEHVRLLQAERRASRRATALQRVATALSEAATTEQIAAIMVEESLRSLGVGAARIQLLRPDPVLAESGGLRGEVVRAAGNVRLLSLEPSQQATPGDGPNAETQPTPGEPDGPQIDQADRMTRVTLALSDRGRYRGRWTLAWIDREAPDADAFPPPPLSPTDWTTQDGLGLLRTLATECGQAIDRAELYEQQREIATVLQRTLLPSVLPAVEGALIAARYQPGGQGVDVGGDWYDVIGLPEGRTGLVIGDVEGHSAAAAAVMGQVRNALRAYAVEGSTPASVMERVNRLLVRLRVTPLVSCCYVEFAPSEGTATVVLAGHPPPLLVTPGSSDYVHADPNLMLGVDECARYVETTVLLDPGTCVVLYTDGLVETTYRSLSEGLNALRRWTTEWDIDDSPDDLVERLIRLAQEERPVLDDVAVLALSYRPTAQVAAHRTRTVRRTFPLDPSSPAAARRFVADVLRQWRLEDVVHQVTLMASELVTNSVLHTSEELELTICADDERLHVEVVDHSERLPTVQHPDADAPGGRGLLIIEAVADRWGVDVRAAGKAVWFEVLIRPASPAG
jgi:anti-sigma regulatory factor (Ser/Thr protein kinase)